MSEYKLAQGYNVALGSPLDPRNPTDDKRSLGIFKPIKTPEPKPVLSATAQVHYSEIKTREEYYEYLGIDASITASYGLSNFNAGFSYEKEIEINDTSIIYLIYGTITYSEQKIPENESLEFSEKGNQELKYAEDHDDFFSFVRKNGSEVVTSINRGTILALIYTYRFNSAKNKEIVRAYVDGSWSSGNVHGKASKDLIQSKETLTVDIDFIETGIELDQKFKKKLSSILSLEVTNYNEIRATIQKILEDVSSSKRSNADIVSFKTVGIQNLVPLELRKKVEIAIAGQSTFNLLVQQMFQVLLRLEKRFQIINKLISEWNSNSYKKNSLKILSEELNITQKSMGDILGQHEKLINTKDPKDFQINLPILEPIPYDNIIELPNITLDSWGYNCYGVQSKNNEGIFYMCVYPIFNVKKLEIVKSLTLKIDRGSSNDAPINYFIKYNKKILQSMDDSEMTWQPGLKNLYYSIVRDYISTGVDWTVDYVKALKRTLELVCKKDELGKNHKVTLTLDDDFTCTYDIQNINVKENIQLSSLNLTSEILELFKKYQSENNIDIVDEI